MARHTQILGKVGAYSLTLNPLHRGASINVWHWFLMCDCCDTVGICSLSHVPHVKLCCRFNFYAGNPTQREIKQRPSRTLTLLQNKQRDTRDCRQTNTTTPHTQPDAGLWYMKCMCTSALVGNAKKKRYNEVQIIIHQKP